MPPHNRWLLTGSLGWLLAGSLLLLPLCLPLNVWIRILVIELLVVLVSIELLTLRLPEKLFEASIGNCYRIDGSTSTRRLARETKAFRKLRSDLWAVFLMVAGGGTAGLLCINEFIFPFALVSDVVAAAGASVGSGDFKESLRDYGVDDQFMNWTRTKHRSSLATADALMRQVWLLGPVLGLLGMLTLLLGGMALRYAYLRALREFYHGVSSRSAEYVTLDCARLQTQAEGLSIAAM